MTEAPPTRHLQSDTKTTDSRIMGDLPSELEGEGLFYVGWVWLLLPTWGEWGMEGCGGGRVGEEKRMRSKIITIKSLTN